MNERKGIITFGGDPVTLIGEETKVGSKAPEFKALKKKLSDAESLEKELGHSLEKFSKATKIYSDLEGKMKEYKIIGINFPERKIYFWMDFAPMYVEFDDYKETYWLKEDKSE